MAEENQPEENEQSGTKSNKKLIITIALVAFLAIGLSVGVTLFLLMGGDEESAVEVEDAAASVEEVKAPASYLEIKPPFLVTFNVEGRQRYMQISLSASARDASVFNNIELHMPLIRSKLISTYAGMDFNLIKTEAGKVGLQEKTVEVINSVLNSEAEGQIENIYFTNFVLQ